MKSKCFNCLSLHKRQLINVAAAFKCSMRNTAARSFAISACLSRQSFTNELNPRTSVSPCILFSTVLCCCSASKLALQLPKARTTLPSLHRMILIRIVCDEEAISLACTLHPQNASPTCLRLIRTSTWSTHCTVAMFPNQVHHAWNTRKLLQ